MENHESEEDDDWVVVKKQKVTILIPPPSPLHPDINNLVRTKSVAVKTRSDVRMHGVIQENQELHTTAVPASMYAANETTIRSSAQDPVCHLDSSPRKFGQPSLSKENGDVQGIAVRKKSIKPLPIGAVNVVNQKMRARNLQRELEGVGGLKKWLTLQGLDQFIKVFERERVGTRHLVNLTMKMLKDMGVDAIGPRRKLIHAIDTICQPYFVKSL